MITWQISFAVMFFLLSNRRIQNDFVTDALEQHAKRFAELLQKKEDLLPELQPYLVEGKGKLTCLKHPLVFSVPHYPNLNAHSNEVYRQKQKAVFDALREKKYETYVFLHERPYRVNAFKTIGPQIKDNPRYWRLMREVWEDSENIWQNAKLWRKLLSSKRTGQRNFMTEAEREFLDELPDFITIYRGTVAPEEADHALSWTLDESKAKWFAGRWGQAGNMRTAAIHKRNVFAYINGRNEQEIILRPRRF